MANEKDAPEIMADIPLAKTIDVPAPKKRGRPPGSKTTQEKSSAIESVRVGTQGGNASNRAEEAAIIGNCGVMLWQLTENILHSALERRLKGNEQAEAAFSEIATKCALTPGESVMIKDSLTKIAQRYEFTTKHAPEVALLMVFASYSARQIQLFSFVKEMKALSEKNEKRAESKS